MPLTTDQLVDHTIPDGQWKFDASVTAVFDDMLKRSIPEHDLMRHTVFDIASRYVQPKTDVVDLGCSRGEALAPLVDKFGSTARFVGLEVSDPMIDAAKERFKGYINCGVVDIRKHDLRQGLPLGVRPSVVLSVLTTMFVPLEHRHRLIRSVYDKLLPGGCLILVEKCLGETAVLDDLFVTLHHEMKSRNGYSADEINRKRLSLEGVLVPVTAKWNADLLRSAGFQQVDEFWRYLNFAGWVAVK